MIIRMEKIGRAFAPALILSLLAALLFGAAAVQASVPGLAEDLAFFGSMKDRSTGSKESEAAADYILKAFESCGLSGTGAQEFLTPVPTIDSASLEVDGQSFEIYPWEPNLVYLPMTSKKGIRGPLVYAGDGDFSAMNGKPIEGAVILMEMASHNNWLNAAGLGAAAIVFIGDKESVRGDFIEKSTQTPIALPRFWTTPEDGEKLKRLAIQAPPKAVVKSKVKWRNTPVRNIYGLLPGKHPKLKKELVVLSAFYDASAHVLGIAPGADESTSITTLLSVARELGKAPPDRSVLFVATAGNGQSHSGMRHFVWAAKSKKKVLKKETDKLKEMKKEADHQLELLQKEDPFSHESTRDRELVLQILVEMAKNKADELIREMMYRKAVSRGEATENVEDPKPYRRFSWLTSLDRMTPEERSTAVTLLNAALADRKGAHKELKLRIQSMKTSMELRNLLEEHTPVLFLNLHLSSNSRDIGAVELEDTYPVKPNMKRTARAGRFVDLLRRIGSDTAAELGLPDPIREASRGGGEEGSGKSYGIDNPASDIPAVAGIPSVSLMTLNDHRALWATPLDTLETVDRDNVEIVASFMSPLLRKLCGHTALKSAIEPGVSGLAALEGQAMFIRQGELFPDQPAPGVVVSVIQGESVFRAMVHRDGSFFLPGLANKRASLEKLIVEPYKLDPETGRVAWAGDKTRTGKENYRINVKGESAASSLVMFRCLQTDVVPVFNPETMGYLTKAEILDAVTEATPLRHWYSRVDGRNSMAVSLFLEKGTHFKLIMAESLLGKEFFLLNSSKENPAGRGFLIGDPATVFLTPRQVANDLRFLLGERLRNLFAHGITNVHLQSLYDASIRDIEEADDHLSKGEFDRAWGSIIPAWAKLDVVYGEIESAQRDVLAGVMFFIALFVPFAYCMERYLFGFRGIYRQIVAFFAILMLTILAIRALHPAFQLTYSPMVVIIAFFIVGLSLLVSWIIFARFEREMAEEHSRSTRGVTPQEGKWQAFGAGFAIGVSNLNRRKLRTALTCSTLVILTFTVMSFTNVKSLHRTALTRIADDEVYRGVLLRHQVRLPLTLQTLEYMKARFGSGDAALWPRAWIDPETTFERTLAGVSFSGRYAPVEGVLGLGETPPDYFRKLVSNGRWFDAGESDAVLLPLAMAAHLNLNPEKDLDVPVRILGDTFRVVGYFDGALLQSSKDLDGNPIVPAYLEIGHAEDLSEVEVEAMQSGEELLPQAERFRYAGEGRTVIIPFEACLQHGGTLKAVSILPSSGAVEVADRLSSWLAYPLFVGENGTWHHSAGTTLRYQGAANLIVPILIVIFITLNTMIGHVHERKREISTYTSVGLAPTHVGFLFIVEALSLAVLSTVIGYMLAQLSAKYLGNTALFSQLTFNYSSLASVACMFLVFSVVFLAALYPARVAAEMAMPDVNRTWTLPAPEGDVIFMNLPFLLKYDEEHGIMNFLNAFYNSHQDVAQGSFIVDGTRLDTDAPQARSGHVPFPACLVIRADVWLAPFDFGIKQRIQLHCCESVDDPGYLEISIMMTRLSGERSAWVRANKNFIKALRKQMLLWRLLDREAKEVFYTGREPVADGA